MQENSKKVFIKSYGCQMNVYDSLRMQDVLKPLGYTPTDDFRDSDLVILNTCHIREKASEKVYSELGMIKKAKDKKRAEGKEMLVTVAGCVAQAEGQEIFARTPFVDIVVGPQAYHRLPNLIEKAAKKSRANGFAIDLDFPEVEKFDLIKNNSSQTGVSAFLSVQEGCDKFCTFCVVPYTRGAEFSRPVEQVYREALELTANGALDINLLGQNVNAYHGIGVDGEQVSLAELIRKLAKIPSLKRIKYTTSHPRDMYDDLINLHGTEEKLMPFVHLPVQSGSDKILEKMNRKHTRDDYLRIIEKFKNARSDIAFSSDFIVGFPGETDADFKDTLKIVEEVAFAQCYSFKYSIRPGTPAGEMELQVPEEVKDERLKELQALICKKQLEFNQDSVGKIMPVLFEKEGKYEGQIIGKSPYMQSVHVMNGKELAGKIVNVKMKEAYQNSLSAEIVENSAKEAA